MRCREPALESPRVKLRRPVRSFNRHSRGWTPLVVAAVTSLSVPRKAFTAEPRSAEPRSSEPRSNEPRSDEPRWAPTANVLLGSLAYQVPTNFEKSFYGGGGFVYMREYFVTARSALGIQAGARLFPAPPLHFAFGYGLSIKHHVGHFGASMSSGFYLKYGLLLQMNFLEGRNGSALGHDTQLAVGYDWTSDVPSPVIEFGYHLTQVRGFDQETVWWPYAEIAAGIRF